MYRNDATDFILSSAKVPIAKIQTMCSLIEVLLTHPGGPTLDIDKQKINPILAMTFIFSMLWAIAGNLVDTYWASVDAFIRNLFDDLGEARLPQHNDLWSSFVDIESRRMDGWEKLLTPFVYAKEIPFFDMIVPTTETIRFGYLLEKLLAAGQSVLFTGLTGVGKSVVARGTLDNIADKNSYVPAYVNFSAQTNSTRTQEMIEAKLEKRKRNVRGGPKGKRVILFVDDLNMPKQDTFGCQPPIELLRQLQDFSGFYDRDKLEWIEIQDITLCAACGPPGGGRNPVTPRLMRHFTVLAIPPPSEQSLKQIFLAIIKGFLKEFPQNVRSAGESIIDAAIEIYSRMAKELLPTPAKSHYVFNLRDLSKCVQGVLQASAPTVRDKKALCRLFSHEAQRVFHDRLIDATDKRFFNEILAEMSGRFFDDPLEPNTYVNNPILFGDFGRGSLPREERLYEEFTSIDKLRHIMTDCLDEYNMAFGKEVKLVFFVDAMEHVCRIARMIRQDRGNALLVGVGGTGKQSLTRLAAHINDYRCFQIELTRGYDYSAFHEDLKKLYFWTAVENTPTVFLFTDNQIIVEEFLEDINNILNSGEVPNLLENEEYERLIIGCREGAKKVGIAEGNREAIFAYAINKVRNNLHIVLCMSPAGSSFRIRCRMFPSLVNCCTIDWFVQWPEEALFGVAKSTFESAELIADDLKERIARISTDIHLSVSDEATRFYQELGRHYYTTPTSYLELLTLYMSIMADKNKELSDLRKKFKNGLDKLFETNELVAKMEIELTKMRPTLEAKQRDTERLMIRLGEDQEKVDVVRKRVAEDEAVAKKQAGETQAIAEDAQRDLSSAIPALEAANRALDSLDKNDISEIRVFTKPPQLVQTVMEAVCLLMGTKTDWPSAKILLGDSAFLRRLVEYPKNDITDLQLKKLAKYIDNPDFLPETVEKTSKACKSLCMWVRALDLYSHVYRTVEPKRQRLDAANIELEKVMKELRKKQAELGKVEQQIATLQAEYTTSVTEKKKLEHHLALTTARLKRAGRLTSALADEQERWSLSVENFQVQIGCLQGDVLIAAACIAYSGAFTAEFRQRMIATWLARCRELEVPVSEDVDLFGVLGDAYELRQWNSQGLPRDQFSTDNAVLVTQSRRWPLMIDPQDQANRWIKSMEAESNLKLAKLSDPRLLRILETSIQVGCPVLIEDVGESLDPALEPVLQQQTFLAGGRLMIRLGDTDVEFSKDFRLYMTTKLPNPHYLPEVAIKVTLINFTVTPSGLEDQLLGDVTGIERPDLEEQRNQLIVRINADKGELKQIEDRILKLLFESEGNILDNEELINTLNESKVKASEINKRLSEATVTEQKIASARQKYAPVAARGSVMYFVITQLAEIDPMYQFSLKYFTNLFNRTIQTTPQVATVEERIQVLLQSTTSSTYTNVARGLFARDKLIFSFMLCSKIMLHQAEVTPEEWVYFLTNPSDQSDRKRPDQPVATLNYLSPTQWRRLIDLAELLPGPFDQLVADVSSAKKFSLAVTLTEDAVLVKSIESNQSSEGETTMTGRPSIKEPPTVFQLVSSDGTPAAVTATSPYNAALTLFQKLLLTSALSEEQLIPAIIDMVKYRLGQKFVEPPPISLPELWPEMKASTPLVFILSSGSDPMSQLQRFAKEQGYSDQLHSVSLGQGQGPNAEALIESSSESGDWVFLQNCHLAASWMVRLERLVKDRSDRPHLCHDDFRLFLSSMPTSSFPIAILQNSVKVTNEPPKGLRANIKRALAELPADQFANHFLGAQWRKLVFGICFFHSIILERKKFGPLGWNIRYDFNDSDRECALLNLEMYCNSTGMIPWDALTYITAEITYGGRVTDFWDQRCLRTILTRFFHSTTLKKDYKYSQSGLYYAPEVLGVDELQTYVNVLPFIDQPEVFGMHENANLVYQLQETNKLITTILGVEPRLGDVVSGKTPDEAVYEQADLILSKLPVKLDIEKARSALFTTDEQGRLDSLTTVLTQEIDRFSKLLTTIRKSLDELQKAIKGLVVMSDELEQIYTAFTRNQVPDLWASVAYPSLKPLASWVNDLVLRCDFIYAWMVRGQPKSFWLSGLFFPQGFLTGTLQNFARKYNYPIDHLSFMYSVLPMYRDQQEVSNLMAQTPVGQELPIDDSLEQPEDGVLVHGLFMDGFRWDDKSMQLTDSILGETLSVMPMLHMLPRLDHVPNASDYASPLYKTSERAGVLSTTGHSTNFVVEIYLPHSSTSAHWIEMGAALLCMRND